MRSDIPEQPASTSEIRDVLTRDVFACLDALERDDSGPNRRNYVRAVFAFLEGSVSIMKSDALANHRMGWCNLSRADVALLLDETYQLNNVGSPETHERFADFKKQLRFACNVFARAHDVTSSPDFSNDGWVRLQDALKVRHRITHPRAAGDVSISDDDLANVRSGYLWFVEVFHILFVEAKAAMLRRLAALPKPTT